MKDEYLLEMTKAWNIPLWYSKDGLGYTSNPHDAQVFSKKEAVVEVGLASEKYVAWPLDDVLANVGVYVKHDNLDKSKAITN